MRVCDDSDSAIYNKVHESNKVQSLGTIVNMQSIFLQLNMGSWNDLHWITQYASIMWPNPSDYYLKPRDLIYSHNNNFILTVCYDLITKLSNSPLIFCCHSNSVGQVRLQFTNDHTRLFHLNNGGGIVRVSSDMELMYLIPYQISDSGTMIVLFRDGVPGNSDLCGTYTCYYANSGNYRWDYGSK